MNFVKQPFLLLSMTFFLCPPAHAADALPFPKAEEKPVIDSYFGIDVLDNYQWMEDAANSAVKTFASAQNTRADQFLKSLPEYQIVMNDEVSETIAAPNNSYTFETESLLVKTASRPISLLIYKLPTFVRDGNTPCILQIFPPTELFRKIWLQHGGIIITAEYNTPPLSADELAVCAQTLFAQKITGPEKLAFLGHDPDSSLGGILLTRYHSFFRALVIPSNIFDRLRTRYAANGGWENIEFGAIRDRAIFNSSFAESAYHQVVDGTKYPAVLLMTEIRNDGVLPCFHSYKMTARLQEATASSHPILLRASDSYERELEDITSFLLHELGVSF